MDRRRFLEGAGWLASGLLFEQPGWAHGVGGDRGLSQAELLNPGTLHPFVDPLPVPPIARSTGTRPNPEDRSRQIPYYRMSMRALRSKVHRDLPPTTFWGFENTGRGSFPGPTMETRSGEPLLVEWTNNLPPKHFLPIDYRLHGAERSTPEVRSVIHLHGGRAPAASDGYPEDWYVPGKSAVYYYPNRQDATLLFYHDHTMGINRLNVYAGLEGLFVIRNAEEEALNLPRGRYEIPLLLCDRFLRRDGELEYPVSGIPGAPWAPEVFGNAILVNGKLLPYLEVEPRRYRLRLLNGSNGRFFRLSFDRGESHARFYGIGSDQGLLEAPVEIEDLQLAPAERADVVIDFQEHAGENLILRSDTFPLMQFRVTSTRTRDTSSLPDRLRSIERLPETHAVKTRRLTLDEYLNMADQSVGMLLNQTRWSAPVTENPVLGTTEIWEFLNSTEDSHPIHLHLVRFQILDRRPFDSSVYLSTGEVSFTGQPVSPAPMEAGWKDTVRADSGMLTRIVVPFTGFTGRYVWHCHILEHEDNEMMRPYEVVSSKGEKAG